MNKSVITRGAAALVLTAIASIWPAAGTAHASITTECMVSRYDTQTLRVWCGEAAPKTQFRAVVTCHNYSAAYYYVVKGTWRTQGGSYWSYGQCNGSDPAISGAVEVK